VYRTSYFRVDFQVQLPSEVGELIQRRREHVSFVILDGETCFAENGLARSLAKPRLHRSDLAADWTMDLVFDAFRHLDPIAGLDSIACHVVFRLFPVRSAEGAANTFQSEAFHRLFFRFAILAGSMPTLERLALTARLVSTLFTRGQLIDDHVPFTSCRR